jgi:hypothetical protein
MTARRRSYRLHDLSRDNGNYRRLESRTSAVWPHPALAPTVTKSCFRMALSWSSETWIAPKPPISRGHSIGSRQATDAKKSQYGGLRRRLGLSLPSKRLPKFFGKTAARLGAVGGCFRSLPRRCCRAALLKAPLSLFDLFVSEPATVLARLVVRCNGCVIPPVRRPYAYLQSHARVPPNRRDCRSMQCHGTDGW